MAVPLGCSVGFWGHCAVHYRYTYARLLPNIAALQHQGGCKGIADVATDASRMDIPKANYGVSDGCKVDIRQKDED